MSKNFKYTHKLYAYENCAKVEFKSRREFDLYNSWYHKNFQRTNSFTLFGENNYQEV